MISQNSAAHAGSKNDIAQRLRDQARHYEQDPWYMVDAALNRAAADEIERLRAELCKLRAPVAEERATKALNRIERRASDDQRQRDLDDLTVVRAALASAPVAGEGVTIPDEAYAALQYVEGSLAATANRQEVVGDVVERLDTIAAAAKRAKAALSRLQSIAQYFDAAPQASADDAVTPPADVAQLVAFIFDRFGQPGDAGALPDNVAAAVRRLERGIKAQADKDCGQQHAGEVLFWYRPRSDGWYEGPIHNDRIEEARKRSGVWVPLIAAPQANAKDVHNSALEKAARLMEQTGKRIAASDIRALKTQADRDGEACAKGDGNV